MIFNIYTLIYIESKHPSDKRSVEITTKKIHAVLIAQIWKVAGFCYTKRSMASPERKAGLPKVELEDILAIFYEDASSDDLMERWATLDRKNHLLAFEIRDRAVTEGVLSRDESSSQRTDRMINFATYLAAVIEHAFERERAEEIRRTTALPFSDDGDDASQPL
jgi:hypothetical protein